MDIRKKIIMLLKEGNTQKEISNIFKKEEIKPNSLSIIEKYLKEIREIYKAKTMFHLAFILIDEEYFIEEEAEFENHI
ncbi:hypothetical protein [Chryseobacterium aquaticum]|uniref:hypothetical protein n=1 Tax=Chryseobacterium aquaticum TaxID=452084 RepID=UPI002FC720F9